MGAGKSGRVVVQVALGGEARAALHELQSASAWDAETAVSMALVAYAKLRHRTTVTLVQVSQTTVDGTPLWMLVDQPRKLRWARLRPVVVDLGGDRKLVCWARHGDRRRRWQIAGVLALLVAAGWLAIGAIA
jgi:hypothetical protein